MDQTREPRKKCWRDVGCGLRAAPSHLSSTAVVSSGCDQHLLQLCLLHTCPLF